MGSGLGGGGGGRGRLGSGGLGFRVWDRGSGVSGSG